MSEITRTLIGLTTYLSPSAQICAENGIEDLNGMVKSCVDDNELSLILDLERIPQLSGLLLEALLDIQDQLARYGGELKLVNANPQVSDVFYLTGFGDYVEIIHKLRG